MILAFVMGAAIATGMTAASSACGRTPKEIGGWLNRKDTPSNEIRMIKVVRTFNGDTIGWIYATSNHRTYFQAAFRNAIAGERPFVIPGNGQGSAIVPIALPLQTSIPLAIRAAAGGTPDAELPASFQRVIAKPEKTSVAMCKSTNA